MLYKIAPGSVHEKEKLHGEDIRSKCLIKKTVTHSEYLSRSETQEIMSVVFKEMTIVYFDEYLHSCMQEVDFFCDRYKAVVF